MPTVMQFRAYFCDFLKETGALIAIYTVRILLITSSYACFTWISGGCKLMAGWGTGGKKNGRRKEKEGWFGSVGRG